MPAQLEDGSGWVRGTGARGGELQDQLCAAAGGGAAAAIRQKTRGVKVSENKKFGVLVDTSLPLRSAYYHSSLFRLFLMPTQYCVHVIYITFGLEL